MFDGEPHPDGEIQAADPRARHRAALMAVAVALLGAGALWFTQGRLDAIRTVAEEDPDRALRMLSGFVRWLGPLMVVPLVGVAAYGYRLAYRIAAARRFPPPGMAVVRDTHVLTGTAAMTRAKLLAALMTLLLAASVAMPIALTRLVEALQVNGDRSVQSISDSRGGRGGGKTLPRRRTS